jgi:hypothetical protein
MSDEHKELALKHPNLTERELTAYRKFATLNQPPVANSTANGFYSLFLQGKSCAKIVELNPGFTLGQVVRCRIEGDWDARAEEHLRRLQEQTSRTMVQIQLEALNHIATSFAVHHKLNGAKMEKFLQTGNEDELAGVDLLPYRKLVEMISEMNEKPSPVKVEIKTGGGEETKVVTGTVERKSPTQILAEMAEKAKKNR